MSSLATENLMVNVQIDGTWKQFPKGTRLIDACMQTGEYIPHYCYHPKLSISGNCRMCLVETGSPKMTPDRKPELGPDGRPIIVWSPRPAISCALEVSEGMAVRTTSPLVEECRKGVMEFLLINHPLDCPICDKAGECRLQEFSVQYGHGGSRFQEEKVKKPKHVDIGKHIVLDDERCILCSRCIRFMQEVAHDDVLGFVDRGSHTTLTVHPGKRLDNNYSLNTVDICPVGALTSKEFRFKMRVWFLKETKTIDVSCGTGCNIIISSRENKIHRITPRQNEEVNSYWMPDSHRLNYHYLDREDRLTKPLLRRQGTLSESSWSEALTTTAAALQQEPTGSIAMLASGRMTNEELFLARRLAQALSIELVDIRPRSQEGDGLLISNDGNPNTRGAQLLGLTGEEPGARVAMIQAGIDSGKISSLICLHENALACGLTTAALEKLKNLVVVDILPNATMALASIVLPGSASAEKRGSMINIKGRLQRLNQAIQAPGEARNDWEILRDFLDLLRNSTSAANCFVAPVLEPSSTSCTLPFCAPEASGTSSTEANLKRGLLKTLPGHPGPTTLEALFSEMAGELSAFQGLNLGKIGDLGIALL